MNPYIILAALLIAGAAIGGAYYRGYESCEADHAKADYDALVTVGERIKTLTEEKNANLAEIDRLRLAGRNAPRLRLPAPPCVGQPAASGVATSGQLYQDVSSRAEDALNRFATRYGDEADRADKLIESCRAAIGVLTPPQ